MTGLPPTIPAVGPDERLFLGRWKSLGPHMAEGTFGRVYEVYDARIVARMVF